MVGSIENTCIWRIIIIWRNAKRKQLWDFEIILIVNVFSDILKIVQECPLFIEIWTMN